MEEKKEARTVGAPSRKRKEVEGDRCPWEALGIVFVGEVVLMGAGLCKWALALGGGDGMGARGAEQKAYLSRFM